MKLSIAKHKQHKDVDVVELHDDKGRLLAVIEPGTGKDGLALAVISNYMTGVGLSDGTPAGIIVTFRNLDDPAETKLIEAPPVAK